MTATRTPRRTKIHGNLEAIDPSEFDLIDVVDTGDEDATWFASFGPHPMQLLEDSGASDFPRSGRCDHCSHHLRYVAVITHTPTGDVFAVGTQCMNHRFAFASTIERKVAALKRAAAERAEQRRIRAEAQRTLVRFLTANLDRAPVLLTAIAEEVAVEPNHFLSDLVTKLHKYGSWSERQMEAAEQAIDRNARRREVKAEEAELPTVPVVTGKGVVITGTVLTCKWQDSDYGGALKMLVRDDRGFKVWGTVPSSLNYSGQSNDYTPDVSSGTVGVRVTFTANVEVSHDDESFGFYKRPRKAERVVVA